MTTATEGNVIVLDREDQRQRQAVKANARQMKDIVSRVFDECDEFGPVRAAPIAAKAGTTLTNAIVAASRIKHPEVGPKARAYVRGMVADARRAWDVIELAMDEKEVR